MRILKLNMIEKQREITVISPINLAKNSTEYTSVN